MNLPLPKPKSSADQSSVTRRLKVAWPFLQTVSPFVVLLISIPLEGPVRVIGILFAIVATIALIGLRCAEAHGWWVALRCSGHLALIASIVGLCFWSYFWPNAADARREASDPDREAAQAAVSDVDDQPFEAARTLLAEEQDAMRHGCKSSGLMGSTIRTALRLAKADGWVLASDSYRKVLDSRAITPHADDRDNYTVRAIEHWHLRWIDPETKATKFLLDRRAFREYHLRRFEMGWIIEEFDDVRLGKAES